MKIKREHIRRSIRLKDYDYSYAGEYFVTICTKNHECVLGEIVGDEMRMNEVGRIVERYWKEISDHFQNVELDEFVIMPNHIHGIITLNEFSCRGEVTSPLQRPTLGKIVAYFKYQSTKLINEINGIQGMRFWQRNYYERVIRDDKELKNIREYITNNVLQWTFNSSQVMPDNICEIGFKVKESAAKYKVKREK